MFPVLLRVDDMASLVDEVSHAALTTLRADTWRLLPAY